MGRHIFTVQDGQLVAHGNGRCHLFYNGDINNGTFRNFEFMADIKTEEHANSGIYIHTDYQDQGWPEKGYEVQIHNTGDDWKLTGSIYNVVNVEDTLIRDGEWFNLHVVVKDKQVVVMINDETIVDYTEKPENLDSNVPGRKLSRGTIAIQSNFANAKTYFKNIKIKVL